MLLMFTTALAGGLTWTGIDYSLVRMVGTQDFQDPGAIFPAYLNTWNDLFLLEKQRELRSRTREPISVSIGQLTHLHSAIDPATRILRDDSISTDALLQRAEVVNHVATSYTPDGQGMALTFIADQLNKPSRSGCFWVTYYDRASLVVHQTDYRCGRAGGIGFRNYWFGTVKSVLAALGPNDVPNPSTVVVLSAEELAAAPLPSAALARAEERQVVMQAEAAKVAAAKESARLEAVEKRNWITIRVQPEALATLSEKGFGYDVVAAGPAPVVQAPPQRATTIVLQAGSNTGSNSSRSNDWPEAECRTAFGKTACGYNCEVAFGDVKCAGSPNGACKVAFGTITCSD